MKNLNYTINLNVDIPSEEYSGYSLRIKGTTENGIWKLNTNNKITLTEFQKIKEALFNVIDNIHKFNTIK